MPTADFLGGSVPTQATPGERAWGGAYTQAMESVLKKNRFR